MGLFENRASRAAKSSVKKIVVGFLIAAIAVPLIFWNEGRAVKRHRLLQEGGKMILEVDPGAFDPTNEGRLVHISGLAEPSQEITDEQFGVSVRALKLKRIAKIYQWDEKEKKDQAPEYEKRWSTSLDLSSEFKHPGGHENPTEMPVRSLDLACDGVSVGAFSLSPRLVNKLNRFERFPVTQSEKWPTFGDLSPTLHDGGIYYGADPAAPVVGDLRIRFDTVEPVEVSIIAKQSGNALVPFPTESGGEIEMLSAGILPAEVMIGKAKKGNKIATWAIRAGGFVVMLVGMTVACRPLSRLADRMPVLGNLAGAGIFVISALLAGVFTSMTVAVSWMFYRPLIGVAMVAVAGALVWVVGRRLKQAD